MRREFCCDLRRKGALRHFLRRHPLGDGLLPVPLGAGALDHRHTRRISPVKFAWYDGGLKPPRPEELEEDRPLKGDGEENDEGLLFVGDRSKILCAFNGARPRLIPETKMNSYKQPPKTLPRSPGNEREWLDACLGNKVKPGGNFEFSGLVTETLLLGNVASRTGQKLNWDRLNLKVPNSEAAQKFVSPERRKGWEL